MTLSVKPFRPVNTLLLAIALVGCTAEPPKSSAPRPEPVITRPLVTAQQSTRLEAVGTARARSSVTLYPEVAGVVEEVLFRAGQQVTALQPLLVLESREEQLAVKLAELALKDARRQYQRFSESVASGAVTPAQFDEAETLLQRAELTLEQAQERLNDHTLKAPFDGVMGITELDPGARVDPSTAIATLDDARELWVRFAVPELFLGQLRRGDTVELSTWTGGDAAVTAEVIDLDSRVDPATRTFTVRAAVTETEQLRPGQSFRVILNLSGGQYPAVPEVALQWGGDGAYVWAVEAGRARRVAVTVVQRRKGEILVDGQFGADTTIVAEGMQRMRDGLEVKNVAGDFLEAGLEATLRPTKIEVQ